MLGSVLSLWPRDGVAVQEGTILCIWGRARYSWPFMSVSPQEDSGCNNVLVLEVTVSEEFRSKVQEMRRRFDQETLGFPGEGGIFPTSSPAASTCCLPGHHDAICILLFLCTVGGRGQLWVGHSCSESQPHLCACAFLTMTQD